MGQYFYVVNLDKRQYLHPHTLGNGLKAWEIAVGKPGTMAALALLLVDNDDFRLPKADPLIGSWAGDRIVMAGDYGPRGDGMNVHEMAEESFENISLRMRTLLESEDWVKQRMGKRWDSD